MTTIERPEKRLLRCEHPRAVVCDCQRQAVAAVLARWPPTPAQPPAEPPGRERVVLAELRAPVVRPPYQHPEPLAVCDEDAEEGDSPLGAAGAWACVAISVLLIVVLALRQLWLWL